MSVEPPQTSENSLHSLAEILPEVLGQLHLTLSADETSSELLLPVGLQLSATLCEAS